MFPYITNDGTVGLFSREDDDIYHSTYGALSESMQKFIIPAHLKEFLQNNNDVKILDICYGIGYNTKAALNLFIKNINTTKKNKTKTNAPNIAAIYADNILGREPRQKNEKNEKNTPSQNKSIEEIYTNNIKGEEIDENNKKKSILIDSVDLDNTLIQLSPFVNSKPKSIFWLKKTKLKQQLGEKNNKYSQMETIQNAKFIRLKRSLKLKQEIPIILLIKLLEQGINPFNNKIIKNILHQKRYSPYLSKYMLNFAKFYSNSGYIYNKKQNKSTFLHNIYYGYISQSYKKAKKILQKADVNINFYNQDARGYIQSTNNSYNFIFLDAFTPAKCPALWTIDFFKVLYNLLDDNGMILTYSNSAAVRNAFIQAGFKVGKTFDAKLNKSIGTIAVKNESLIEYPLVEKDWALINSKAGICYKDKNLDLDNHSIITNRVIDVANSRLESSSKVLKGFKNCEH